MRNWNTPLYRYFTAEDRLATAVADYVRYQYPKALWWHTPNEGKRSHVVQMKAKAMGMLAGVSDLIFPSNLPNVKGLIIELKVAPNKCTPAQTDFLKRMHDYGWIAQVHYNFDTAINSIDAFYKLK